MLKRGKLLLLIGLGLVFAIGYMAGQTLQAQPGSSALVPGSADDPVVSKSYAEQAVAEATAALRGQVTTLQARVEELTRVITALEAAQTGSGHASVQPGSSQPTQPGVPTQPTQPVQPSPPAPRQAKVTVDIANVRSRPDVNSTRVTTLSKGTSVTVLAEQDGWLQVSKPGGKTGWVLGTLLEVVH